MKTIFFVSKFSEKQLLKPSTTRFAYSFIMLSNLLDDRVKTGLRIMMVSEQWCQWKGSKTQGEVLRLVDREGATYECTQRMIEEINHIEDVDYIMH